MKYQISLSGSDTRGGSWSIPVQVASVQELIEELKKVGAKRWALYWKDPLGDGKVEGTFHPLEELNDQHFQWVIESEPLKNKQILYDSYDK